MAASDIGNAEVVRLLLKAGADVNSKTAEGVTARAARRSQETAKLPECFWTVAPIQI